MFGLHVQLIMFILAGTLFSNPQHQIELSADFGFVFEYGVSSTNTLDTFTGWFVDNRASQGVNRRRRRFR